MSEDKELLIRLPAEVFEWLRINAEEDFRSPEEYAAVLIRRMHRDEQRSIYRELSSLIKNYSEAEADTQSESPCSW